jgi:hypothetical protein
MYVRIGGIFLLLILIVTFGHTQVQVSLPDTTVDWNSQVTIPVQVTNITSYDIYSYEFFVKYDSMILTPKNADHQNTLAAGWPTPVFNDSTKGTLIVGGYGAQKLAGSGRLVNIAFDVVGNPDEVCDLIFTYFLFNNGSPTQTTVNGRVKITSNLVAVTITTNVLDSTEIKVDGKSYSAPYSTYWEIGSQHQISAPSPQTFGSKRYIFKSWSNQGSQTHSVSVSQPTTFTADYTTQYYLSIQSNHGNPLGSGWYHAETTAQFSVDSSTIEGGNTRYNFISWSGSGSGSYSGSSRKASVVMNNPITETANWSKQYYVEIISPYGNPYGTGWYSPGSAVNFGIDSTTITRSNAHCQFISWTGSGNGSYTGTNSKATISVSVPISEKANWDAECLVVTGSEPEGILQVPGTAWYQQGQQFTTIKAPDTLTLHQIVYIFKGWKVNEQIVSGNPLTLLINEPKTIIADYSSDVTVVVTTNVGQGTKVIVDGEQKDAPYTTQWAAGSRHSIGIVNVQNGTPGIRYLYRRWSHGGNQTHEVTPSANTTYIAELETQFYLDVKDEPSGVVKPTGSGWYSAMQLVKLDSLPQNKLNGQSSYRFLKWQVDGIDSLKATITILIDAPRTAIAVYQKGFYISGNITFVGSGSVPITLNVSGKENFMVQSNHDGSYLIAGLQTGDYVVTLSRPAYRFEPTNRAYQIQKNEELQYYFAFYNPTSVIPDDGSDLTPEHYKLSQNYPNPFAHQTTIEYALKKEGHVKLTVYNILGQVIKQLVDFQQPAGYHRIQWNRVDFQGIKVPCGVYFYRIEAGNFIQIKKMIVL